MTFLTTVFNIHSLTHHSIASSNPSPLVAEVLKMAQVLLLSAARPRALETSEGLMAPSRSCLLAKTHRMAVFNSSSYKRRGKEREGKMKRRLKERGGSIGVGVNKGKQREEPHEHMYTHTLERAHTHTHTHTLTWSNTNVAST